MSKNHFFIFNPKSYLYGKELEELARTADKVAKEVDFEIYVTAPYADLYRIKEATENITVCAQHLDGINPGRGMGAVLPDSLKEAGAGAVFLNHAEHPLTLAQLVQAVKRSKELGLTTIVCANTVEEAKAVATLGVDILLCEPTELIGTGQVSDESYVRDTINEIKSIDPNVLIMQAAGISNPLDVYNVISLGADGTGCTSGIVKAGNPKEMLVDMVKAMELAIKGENYDSSL
ncbi:triose-phosphate isomerase [Streptococcus massiliensis]|uniref:Triosephosphate isomerase n=1 Tax=Streptococcus massiliensis TaxID=313439 RepID=A0A380KZL0_9STRE|nr:triose-phosphate isomerase [Streptococcus massiliensis]SUN77434.1 triosephosphate isomerase [Streptococcus massiliensis]